MSDMVQRKVKAEKIIKQYADMIYRIALHNLRNVSDAEDVFQEVSLSLLTKNAPLDDDAHIKNWLIRVTVNKCNNFHRSVWQSRTVPLEQTENEAFETDTSALEIMYSLPAKDRNILYLFYYEDYTIAEIAGILQLNKNTVNSRLQRARKKLRKILEDGDSL